MLRFILSSRFLPDFVVLLMVLFLQGAGALMLARDWPPRRRAILSVTGVSYALLMLGFALRIHRISRFFPASISESVPSVALLWAFVYVLGLVSYVIWRRLPVPDPKHSPARRYFLRAVEIAVLGAPAAVTGYGIFIERVNLRLREENIVLPWLPQELDGLRIVQLSDIHLSPFLSVRDLDRAIGMANETQADIALVTGDLITTGNDPLDICLDRLARLRARAGVFGCMGNHEIYANAESYVEEKGARLGMEFLRSRARPLKFGSAVLNLAGVDYQHLNRPYLVGAENLAQPGAVNVLLSHNPDVFPVAMKKGFQLTISGHTHGGQINFEIVNQGLNVARFFTPYVDGLYRAGASAIFVSRGIGTIGLPVRLGAPPEVALLRLCRT